MQVLVAKPRVASTELKRACNFCQFYWVRQCGRPDASTYRTLRGPPALVNPHGTRPHNDTRRPGWHGVAWLEGAPVEGWKDAGAVIPLAHTTITTMVTGRQGY